MKDEQGMGYPKRGKRKKRKMHGKSILQRVEDWKRCYICMLRNDDYREREDLETHHVMFGAGRRPKAEEDGLTVRLCRPHHEEVHHDAESRQRLCQIAQRAYEREHTREKWMERYKRNYLEDMDEYSYSTMMMYEIVDIFDDALTVIEAEGNNNAELD